MTNSERDLLWALTRAVQLLLANAGLDETAQEFRKRVYAVRHKMAQEWADSEFAPVLAAFDDAEEHASLAHTGGGVFVVYHYVYGPSKPDGPYVCITPSETTEGLWLICGYQHDESGAEFCKDVPLSEVVDYTLEVEEQLLAEDLTLGRWQIPGTFYVTETYERHDNGDRMLRYTFLPAAGDAGYFGPAIIDANSGLEFNMDNSPESIWTRIGLDLNDKDSLTVRWES